jgi:hypothetical protein
MEDNAYIGGAIAGFVYLIAGARLIRLSIKTSELPERLLGATFLVWSVSYLFWQLAIALGNESLVTPFLFIGHLAAEAGQLTFLLFMWLVFRRRERWALWLVAGLALCSMIGVGGSIWVGDLESTSPLSNPFYWMEILSGTGLEVWTLAEGFNHYRMARQRLRLGLCDPLVCNRYLLWGLTGLIWTILEVVIVANDIVYELTGVWVATMDYLLAGLELGAIAMIWLVFFPPRFYQQWVGNTAETVQAGGS